MLKAFGGDQVLALAAYNAGPRRVKAGTLSIETRRFTRDVIFLAKRLRQAAPEIEYLGPLEEEAPEIEYLGPLEEDLGPVGSNVVRKPIPLGQGMGAASAEDEPEIEYLGPL